MSWQAMVTISVVYGSGFLAAAYMAAKDHPFLAFFVLLMLASIQIKES